MEHELDSLPRETLVELSRMYARNWQTLDGLWFRNIESEFGLDAAVRIDLKNWEKQSVVEAQRIMDVLKIRQGGIRNILRVLTFMSWQVASPSFKIEEEDEGRVVFSYPVCPIQEGRRKKGKDEFPCRTMKTLLLSSIARVVEPGAKLSCLFCPPDARTGEVWCKWELTLEPGQPG